MVEMRTQLAIERAGLVTLHLPLARRSSIPTTIVRQMPFHPLNRCTLLRVVSARGPGSPVADAVVVAFVVIGLLGVRLPFALIVGYSLHGLWDLLHELQAHGAYSAFEPGKLTAIPLAYGFFCAAFDFSMAAYFDTRRGEWSAARKAVPK